MTVIIPMAGQGSRFKKAGFLLDKPFILVNGRPMIELVVNNINRKDDHHIFLVKKEHYEKYGLSDYLPSLVKNCDIVQIDKTTEGAACTVALAEPYIRSNGLTVVANSDQYVNLNLDGFFQYAENFNGTILTFEANHPKWSYVETINNQYFRFINHNRYGPFDYDISSGEVTRVVEKQVISNRATVGIYTWGTPHFLFESIRTMIKENFRVNNEFYLCPSYQYLLDMKIMDFMIHPETIWGLGTPEDLEYFIKNFRQDSKPF